MRRLLSFLTVPVLATFVVLSACASESEGYPCSQSNGNDDCNDGLQCVVPPNPNATNAPMVCCPVQGQPATTPECSVSGRIDAGNPAQPDGSTFPETSTPDSGTHETSTPDATSDTSTSDGPSEATPPGDAGAG
jgi:hypothetical protein